MTDGQVVLGWVRTEDLKRAPTVDAVYTPLARASMVSTEARMDQLLAKLGAAGLVFVVDDAGVSGFVAPSDLERHAARSHFQLLITAVEILLAQVVRAQVDADRVVAKIRAREAKRWHLALASEQETDPVEYLYLRDLVVLFQSTYSSRPS